MPEVLKTSLRIARFVGKLILGLLIILISAVAIVHLPPVQRQITRSLSNYLSSKIEAKVYIERVEFSIFGQVIIQGLTVWNRHEVKLFSIQKIEVNSSLYDLVTGDLIFDEILIVGLTGKLSEDENGLNIQFILDAFQSAEKESTTAESTVVKLQFKNVQLENIDFEFESIPSGISVANIIGILTIQNAELSTYPLILTADNVALQRSTVNILSNTVAETSNDNSISKPDSIDIDTRAGIRIHVAGLHIKDSDFSFHQDAIVHTPKFDPGHIDLKNIQIGLSDIFVGVKKDTVAAILQSLSVQLPGFKVDEARADLHWSQNYLAASGLHFASNTNSLHADFASRYELQSDKDFDHAHVTIDASGTINPTDLSYFISDSILNNVKHWSSASLTLEGQYHLGEGEIKTFNVQTGNSQLHVAGKMGDVTNLEKLYWNDLTINTTIGSDFKQTLNPHLRTINLPADVAVNIRSSGNLKGSSVDGNVSSDWGNVKLNGVAGQQAEDFKINMDLIADQIDLGKWMNVSSIGPVTLTANANGLIGDHTNVEIKGLINDIKLMDENIHSIDFQSTVEKSNALVNLQIADPKYKSEIHSEIQFAGPLMLTTNATVTDFQVGDLLQMDSTLSISGNLKSKVTIESSSIEGYVAGDTLIFQNHSTRYALDSLNLHTLLSPTVTEFEYYSDNEKANLTANFDIQKSLEEIQSRLIHIWKGNSIPVRSIGNKKLEFNIALDKAKLLQLLGLKVEDFSSLNIEGEWDEQKKSTLLHVATGNFKAYGVSLDSLNSNLTVLKDSLSALLNAKNLVYNSIALGNVDFDILSKGDTAVSNFLLMNDTITVLGLRTRILPTDSGTFVFPDQVMALDHDYSIDRSNPVYFDSKNIVLDNFQVSREDMHIKVDGDINKFDASLQHVDLIPLNLILSSNTTVISKGFLNADITYSPKDRILNLKARVDSLSLYNSNLLTIEANAQSTGDPNVPFEFLLTNTTNRIDLTGKYNIDNAEVDANMLIDLNNPEMFSFLVSGVIDEMSGVIKGETKISGPIQQPVFKGHLQFQDLELTTLNPKFNFNVQDDRVTLDSSSVVFNHFTLYDKEHHPLIVDGSIKSKDYQSFSYDLKLKAENYTLMNKPDSASGRINGVLVVDSDIKLKGNEKDTHVEAKVTIKDQTDLAYVSSTDDIELLKADGIIEFIDPAVALDTALQQSANFYDSLIASLPDFNLSSHVKIESDAKLRMVIDAQSGDYIETTGGADLAMDYDRIGNLHLVGDYTVKQGIYRLSFYDLVKRNFTLVPNSSIHWSGSPENGDLNIKAIHTVESNSIGLIGHEIGENEKSVYKRALDYEVGIIIGGTLDKPIVSFSLDLPQKEKANYPVLSNKLDRLRQPEYQSELNKQVFGLLVLGGFIPESGGSDINSSQIATTALSNSVNSLLANQLNKFASQYIKGVNIDVGIQSYSDYSAPGGKTQTAMDFRVSKRVLDDRLSFEIGGDFDINSDQSGANTGTKNYRGDIAIVYDLTGNGDKQLKFFNNETYDIVYQEIRNTGISLIFIREFSKEDKKKRKKK